MLGTKLFETTRYTILFFGSPAQGDGSSVKLCEEVGKSFKPRLGRSGRASSVLKEATESRASKPRGRPRGRPQGRPRGSPRGRRSLNIQAQPQSYEAGREAGLEAGEAGVEASLEASRHEASGLSARLKSLEAGLGGKPRAWLAGRTKAYK